MRNEILHFKEGRPEDAVQLRELAYQSERHWGYDPAFMEVFDRTFNITEQFILEHPVFTAWEKDQLAGFWGLQMKKEKWELEYFYVSEAVIGHGVGRQMWSHMTDWCREHGICHIHFVTSPQAVGFYERMGAVQAGTVPSSIDGREIPYLVYGKRG